MTADRIREVREKKGLTQAALAKKLGITRSSVNAWELGVNVPSAQYIVELSRIFKVSADYLLNIDPHESLDITYLAEEETSVIYLLLGCFDKYRQYDRLVKEMNRLKKQGIKFPDSVTEILELIDE